MSKKQFALLFFLLPFFLGNQTAFAMEDISLTFGVVPIKPPVLTKKIFEPIKQQLEKKVNMKIHLIIPPSIKLFTKKACAENYDLIWPNNVGYFSLNEKCNYSAIIQGQPAFHGGVIVRKDSGIINLSQLRGKIIASISKKSYGSHLFIKKELEKVGLDPENDVQFIIKGNLEWIVHAVINKVVDAGGIRLETLDHKKFASIRDELQIISTSPPIPQFPFAVRNDLSWDIKSAFMEAFQEMQSKDPEGKKILDGLGIESFSPASVQEYVDFKRVYYEALK